jgi:hypothetical protein
LRLLSSEVCRYARSGIQLLNVSVNWSHHWNQLMAFMRIADAFVSGLRNDSTTSQLVPVSNQATNITDSTPSQLVMTERDGRNNWRRVSIYSHSASQVHGPPDRHEHDWPEHRQFGPHGHVPDVFFAQHGLEVPHWHGFGVAVSQQHFAVPALSSQQHFAAPALPSQHVDIGMSEVTGLNLFSVTVLHSLSISSIIFHITDWSSLSIFLNMWSFVNSDHYLIQHSFLIFGKSKKLIFPMINWDTRVVAWSSSDSELPVTLIIQGTDHLAICPAAKRIGRVFTIYSDRDSYWNCKLMLLSLFSWQNWG